MYSFVGACQTSKSIQFLLVPVSPLIFDTIFTKLGQFCRFWGVLPPNWTLMISLMIRVFGGLDPENDLSVQVHVGSWIGNIPNNPPDLTTWPLWGWWQNNWHFQWRNVTWKTMENDDLPNHRCLFIGSMYGKFTYIYHKYQPTFTIQRGDYQVPC